MSQKTAKTLGVILTLTLAASMFAACTNKEAVNTTETTSKPTSTSEAQEPVTIDWLAYNSFGQVDPDTKIQKMVSEKFNAQYNIWYIDTNKWVDTLNVKLAAGEMPDVMYIKPDYNTINKYVSNGVLAPISEDTIRKFAPNYAALIDKYELWNTVKSDGEIYALPSVNINGDYPTSLIWRKDWLKNVGITKTPETLQEFEEALTKIRNNDPDQNGKKDTYGLSDYALPAILGAFGHPGISDFKNAGKGIVNLDYIQKDGKITFAAIQPEMKDALKLLHKWYKAELIDPEFITSENTGGYWAESNAMLNNRISLTGKGMYYHWRDTLNPVISTDLGGGLFQNLKKSQPTAEIAFGKPPVGPDGKSGTIQWGVNSVPVGITTKAAKDPRKVETILKMAEASITDYSYYTTTFRGVEGEDWKDESGNIISLNPAITTADANKKGISVFHMIESPDFNKKNDAFNYEFADRVKTTGYVPFPAPTVDAYGKHAVNLTKLTDDYYLKIILGEASPDVFDEFVQKFKANGGDEIEKEVNDIYNKNIGQ
ncbi:ABC transporter substrate-binding protein [Paenibacillus swuensis]|uniref:ABC transporter substrate-binding protein n=1 Tax=Paenibacillus swuensis TaxID=1178515 RepID=A0A172TE51_9BACL|nr:extracellular solute-binding protein [Paenibacillus swuensis]ANE45216.1 ABC transporter substrate-binding protein [Paenibacillus swuensis]